MTEPNDGLVKPIASHIEEEMNFEISTEIALPSNFLIPNQPDVNKENQREKEVVQLKIVRKDRKLTTRNVTIVAQQRLKPRRKMTESALLQISTTT